MTVPGSEMKCCRQDRRPWTVEAYASRGGGCDGSHWHEVWHLKPERRLSAAIRSIVALGQSGRWRVRNIQTGDILTFDQAEAITRLRLPLIPEVLESFFAAKSGGIRQ